LCCWASAHALPASDDDCPASSNDAAPACMRARSSMLVPTLLPHRHTHTLL
jgi:hypothetical protein